MYCQACVLCPRTKKKVALTFVKCWKVPLHCLRGTMAGISKFCPKTKYCFFVQNVWNMLQKVNIAFNLLKKVHYSVNREIPAILPGYPNHLINTAGGKIHSAMQHYYFYNPNTKVCLKKIVLHIYNSKCVTVLLKETLSYLKLVSFGLWRTVLLLQFIFQKISIKHTEKSKVRYV